MAAFISITVGKNDFPEDLWNYLSKKALLRRLTIDHLQDEKLKEICEIADYVDFHHSLTVGHTLKQTQAWYESVASRRAEAEGYEI